MPKEMIYGNSLPYGEEEPARSVVEVRWNREAGYFQMATKCVHAADESDYVRKLEPIEVLPERISRQEIVFPETELLEAEGIVSSGFYVELNRSGINDLIRVLRRARDQAFGRDE